MGSSAERLYQALYPRRVRTGRASEDADEIGAGIEFWKSINLDRRTEFPKNRFQGLGQGTLINGFEAE